MANPINPDDFVPVIDNPFFTLEPGATFTTESPDGSEVDTFVVTRQTKVIDGVVVHVIHDTATVDGEVVEKTNDYFAQDKVGNVWYFGEDTKEFENGKVVSTEGTWRAGVDGAQPGIIMEAHPKVGDEYNQENAPGVAEDHAKVLSVDASVTVPYGTFDHVLVTEETSPLTPDEIEWKHYAAGVGFLLTLDGMAPHDNLEQLVSIRVDGSVHGDNLFGYGGGDLVNGNAGNDTLDGRAGSDTINGGMGNDLLHGGDDKVADILHGNSGHDTIDAGTADHAFGDTGNDLIHLLDNTGFGSIDGGTQNFHNVGSHAGDVLQFDGTLDLTTPGLSERITGIETLSMHDGKGDDSCTLSAQDVLDLGSGTFDPHLGAHDSFGKGDAVRVDGDASDKLNLAGGGWSKLDPSNGPDDFDVFAHHAPAGGGNVYVLVQEDVAVSMS